MPHRLAMPRNSDRQAGTNVLRPIGAIFSNAYACCFHDESFIVLIALISQQQLKITFKSFSILKEPAT
jgi:hypothetical protein